MQQGEAKASSACIPTRESSQGCLSRGVAFFLSGEQVSHITTCGGQLHLSDQELAIDDFHCLESPECHSCSTDSIADTERKVRGLVEWQIGVS